MLLITPSNLSQASCDGRRQRTKPARLQNNYRIRRKASRHTMRLRLAGADERHLLRPHQELLFLNAQAQPAPSCDHNCTNFRSRLDGNREKLLGPSRLVGYSCHCSRPVVCLQLVGSLGNQEPQLIPPLQDLLFLTTQTQPSNQSCTRSSAELERNCKQIPWTGLSGPSPEHPHHAQSRRSHHVSE